MKKVTIIGIGMGNPDTLTVEAARCIQEAQVLIGQERMLELADRSAQVTYASYNSREIFEFIEKEKYESFVVLMSGDTGFFSGANGLGKLLANCEVEVLPGISSISYLAAKIGISWQDAAIISVHGRKANLVQTVMSNKKTFVLTEGKLDTICRKLTEAGLGECVVYVGERLSYHEESILCEKAKNLTGITAQSLSALFIINDRAEKPLLLGLPDDLFIRGEVPMTKSEVRAVILSKLRLSANQTVYDIGAGTGSVSVELAAALPEGVVYSLEQKEEAICLLNANKEKFHLDNLEVVKGSAPDAFSSLPAPDAVFIGGSSGRLKDMIEALLAKKKEMRIVIAAIALETLSEALDLCRKYNLNETEVIQLAVNRVNIVGNYHMMKGQNPIFIISAVVPPLTDNNATDDKRGSAVTMVTSRIEH